MKNIIKIIILFGLFASCRNTTLIIDNRGQSESIEGFYKVEFVGNPIGTPLIQLNIYKDSAYDYFVIGDCYRRISHGKISNSESGLYFESFVENPFQFSTRLNRDSTQSNNTMIEIVMDSYFDSCQLKWFLVTGEDIYEDKVNFHHFQISDKEPPFNVRLIGIKNEKRCKTTTERDVVCSQDIEIDTYGVYWLSTDTSFAKYPLHYIPTEGVCKIDKYGNVLWSDLYFFRKKSQDVSPYYYFKNNNQR